MDRTGGSGGMGVGGGHAPPCPCLGPEGLAGKEGRLQGAGPWASPPPVEGGFWGLRGPWDGVVGESLGGQRVGLGRVVLGRGRVENWSCRWGAMGGGGTRLDALAAH